MTPLDFARNLVASDRPADPEEWEPRGRPDPLTARERDSIAPFRCDLCGAMLLTLETGPHYRAMHPDAAPKVTRR